MGDINGLVQYCSNSIADTLELLQSCNKPSSTYGLWSILILYKRDFKLFHQTCWIALTWHYLRWYCIWAILANIFEFQTLRSPVAAVAVATVAVAGHGRRVSGCERPELNTNGVPAGRTAPAPHLKQMEEKRWNRMPLFHQQTSVLSKSRTVISPKVRSRQPSHWNESLILAMFSAWAIFFFVFFCFFVVFFGFWAESHDIISNTVPNTVNYFV